MLKGHVFKEQVFGNQIFALFINTFLNGQNGVSNNYKNGMEVTYNGNSVTINSGAVCIQGRFLEEDTNTELDVGTDNNYCKLVIEIDLDKQNTDELLVQASYKILKSSSGYPSLTQTNIVKNNAGVYQYELARFKTSSSGISDFQDMRTFLDFNSIYSEIQTNYRTILNELEEELADVEDGSAYVLKNNLTEEEILVNNEYAIVKLIKIGKLRTIIAYTKNTITDSRGWSFTLPDDSRPSDAKAALLDYNPYINDSYGISAYSILSLQYFNINQKDNGINRSFYNSLTYYVD